MHHTQTFLNNPFTFNMLHIEGGAFDMGSNDKDAENAEKPVHSVSLKSFWMGQFPVTQVLWALVMQDTDISNPSFCKGENHPVECVSWEDITKVFLPNLNELTKALRPKDSYYRLPTEAEWEYAAKGGKYAKDFPFKYAGSNNLNEVGWYYEKSHRDTKPVGLKTPNFLGLYDMSGNVWEWCEDQWHNSYKGAPNDGSAWVDNTDEGYHRMYRGGSWYFNPKGCRSTFRSGSTVTDRVSYLGFRLAMSSFQ